jgi:hypothetical protein
LKVIHALFFACVSIPALAHINIPQNLSVPNDQRLSLQLDAAGVQIYECLPKKDDPTKYEWSLKAPEAKLFDSEGKQLGKHYAGPTWELNDGSKVVGELKAKSDSPESNSIPWLLLNAKSNAGSGKLSEVKSIQRVDTHDGKLSQSTCDKANEGKENRVNYKATYYFYK